jgi:hypothetical protein
MLISVLYISVDGTKLLELNLGDRAHGSVVG